MKGLSLIETLLTLTLTLSILGVVLASVSQTTKHSAKISKTQARLEAVFHTVDQLKSDLNQCGMRLQEAASAFGVVMFQSTDSGFQVVYGRDTEHFAVHAFQGENQIHTHPNALFRKGKNVLIYNIDRQSCQKALIARNDSGVLTIDAGLQHDFPAGSILIPLREVEYRFYPAQKALKRKVDRGTFQPLLDEVSLFTLTYYPENHSVLYRIEVNKKENVRGYIYLINTVTP